MARVRLKGPEFLYNKNVFDYRHLGINYFLLIRPLFAVYEVYPENLYNYFLQPSFMIVRNQN